MNYQRLTVVLLAVFVGASVVLGAVAWRVDHRQEQQIKKNGKITLESICLARTVIRQQPHRVPSFAEGETTAEFQQRIATYKIFLQKSERVCGRLP